MNNIYSKLSIKQTVSATFNWFLFLFVFWFFFFWEWGFLQKNELQEGGEEEKAEEERMVLSHPGVLL